VRRRRDANPPSPFSKRARVAFPFARAILSPRRPRGSRGAPPRLRPSPPFADALPTSTRSPSTRERDDANASRLAKRQRVVVAADRAPESSKDEAYRQRPSSSTTRTLARVWRVPPGSPPPLLSKEPRASESASDGAEGAGAGGGDAGGGGGAAAGDDADAPADEMDGDEAFARKLQEEENARWRAERERAAERAAEWRRSQEALEATLAEVDDEFGDSDDDGDDDDDANGFDLENALADAAAGAGGGAGGGSADPERAARDARRRTTAAARRARVMQLHQIMGALHQRVYALQGVAGARPEIAALAMSDRDFDEDDYERLLALDDDVKRRGVSAAALARIPVFQWKENGEEEATAVEGATAPGPGPGPGPSEDAPAPAPPPAKKAVRVCETDARCAVCLETYVAGDALRRLPCLHAYHKDCVDQWFARSVECPVCKHDVNQDDVAA